MFVLAMEIASSVARSRSDERLRTFATLRRRLTMSKNVRQGCQGKSNIASIE